LDSRLRITGTSKKKRIHFVQGGEEDANFFVRPMSESTTKKKNRTRSNRERIRAEKEKERHEILAEENIHVGFMFGSKALIQVIANPM
jgi:hypothetical protein